MICPECNEEIKTVKVYSQCWQKAELKENYVINYGVIEEILETVEIECPKCFGDITQDVIQ